MKRSLTTLLLCCICSLLTFAGINKTLNDAQALFKSATNIEQYQKAKKKFQSAKTDVGYVPAEHDKAINDGVRKCESRINELSPRLKVNGESSTANISFSGSGGSQTLTISTNQGTPYCSALPSWISVSSTSTSAITIYCNSNSSSSSRTDWFNVNAGNKTVRVNVTQAASARRDTYLRVDNTTAVSRSFASSGGSVTFSVSTDAGSWDTWGIPNFCEVTNRTSTSFTLKCNPNTTGSSRSDYMKIKTANHEVRIDITQSAGSSTSSSSSSSSHTANIEKVWLTQNETENGVLGLKVHVKFTIAGMKGLNGRASAYFYDSSNNQIRDTNGSYGTTGDVSYAASSTDITPGYDNSRYDDLTIFMPYSELHQSGSYSRTIKVLVSIWDNSSTSHKELTQNYYTTFSYTPKVASYLRVDGKTSVSTSFSSSGGTETFSVSTDGASWDTWGIPSFCEVTNRTATSFTLKCNPNTGSQRSDYMKIKSGDKEVRIDITQYAGSSSSSSSGLATARFNRIWVDHNAYEDGKKGMKIHMHLEVDNAKNHNVRVIAYFYFTSGTALKDYDDSYNTTDGNVSCGKSITPGYDYTEWKDLTMFMPYDQLHLSKSGTHHLKFYMSVRDRTSDKWLGEDSQWETFDITY